MENNQLLHLHSHAANLADKTPYTFKQWLGNTSGIIPGQEYQLYTEYLIEWYKQYNLTTQDSKALIKIKYLSLLNQLQLFFSTTELENWYNKVNIEDEKELLLAIPYFARKLKEIAYYYFQLREKVKTSRIRHGVVGTEISISQQLRELLFNKYTQSGISLPASIWEKVPALSSITSDIHIVIEDLYDTFSYFDHTAALPASAYYDTTDTAVQDFILSRNLALSSTEWLYKLGTTAFSLSSNSSILQQLHQRLIEQTLGNNVFTGEFYSVSASKDIYNLNISQGVNSFYWPQGNYVSKTTQLPRYEPVSLSSESLKQIGSPGDTIFTRTKDNIEGAWLYNKTTDVRNIELQAKFNANKKTVFKFPFPGYGISAEDISWTGYDFKTDIRFNYLDDDIKRAIENVYWNTSTTLSSVEPIKINDTTLAEQGAYSSTIYKNADKIRVRNIPPSYNSSTYAGNIQEAWLYRLNETSISIPTRQNTTILWPYKKIDNPKTTTNVPITNFNNVCTPIPLSSLNINYSVGGSGIKGSDVIYKIKNQGDEIKDATECAWLSAPPYLNSFLELTGSQQSSLNCLFSAGSFTRFIWDGPNNTDVNNIFKHSNHYPNCEYLNITNPTVNDFTKCTCKQVNFSPFGHPGQQFTDYNKQTDFIVEDNFTPKSFDINVWTDSTGTRFAESSAFCWYKTNKNVGWNPGKWNSGSTITNNNFYLKKGRCYVYYRANSREPNKTLPTYVVQYRYNKYPGKWMKGIKYRFSRDKVNWIGLNELSDMTLYPGDYLIYSRSPNLYYTLTGESVSPVLTGLRTQSIWSNYDYISIPNNAIRQIPLNITFNFPTQDYTTQSASSQYPPPGTFNKILQYIAWKLTTPDNKQIYYYNTPSFSFVPTLTGVYTATLTALTGIIDNELPVDGYYYATNIPPVTATILYSSTPLLTSANVSVPGFTLRVPLKGWDYNTNSYNPSPVHSNFGAKPYWASFKTDKNSINVPSVVDNYNLITVPDISEIEFSGSEHVEYYRAYNTDFIWSQPLTFLSPINERYWNTLQINTSGITNDDLFKTEYNSYITQLSTPSNLILRNYVENEPVEVVYNANSNFVWNITATPIIESKIINSTDPDLLYQTTLPWKNILNVKNPSLAIFPTVESLYTKDELGGFFVPEYCGITKYLNQDYTYMLDITSSALTSIYLDPDIAINIRGLSKEDKNAPYNFKDNNTWLKEPPISNNIAGTIKKDAFKKYQKFIPYQSVFETNPTKSLGLVLPTSQQTPWTGEKNTEWGDVENQPKGLTEVINISSWTASQILKNTNLYLDSWSTDIYNNQYGLYKDFNGLTYFNQQNTPGEIWIRDNKQRVYPGYMGLSSVFDTFVNTSLYSLLTGNNIYKIDVFYNTLYIETSSVIFLEKINYDFTTNKIFSISDDARFISLMTPVTTSVVRELNNVTGTNFALAGETWFNPDTNIVLFSTASLSGHKLHPTLFEYNLISGTLKKVFPVTQKDVFKLTRTDNLQLKQISKPKLSYNKNYQQYVLAIPGIDTSDKNFIIELKLNNFTYDLYSLTTYQPTTEVLPPVITHSLLYNLTAGQTFSIQLTSSPAGATFEGINLPTWVNVTATGYFIGQAPIDSLGSNFINFSVSNENGTIYQVLTINIL